jgi:hypothetical protein
MPSFRGAFTRGRQGNQWRTLRAGEKNAKPDRWLALMKKAYMGLQIIARGVR